MREELAEDTANAGSPGTVPLLVPRAHLQRQLMAQHSPDLFICAQQRETALLPASILQSNASHSIVTVFHYLLEDFHVFNLKERELWREGHRIKEGALWFPFSAE